jgi:hypothetical protein
MKRTLRFFGGAEIRGPAARAAPPSRKLLRERVGIVHLVLGSLLDGERLAQPV